MKHLLLFIILLSLVFKLSAQDNSDSTNNNGIKKFRSEIGVAAGSTTGFGLSYRQFYKDFGVQLTFCPIELNKEALIFSSGVAFIYHIQQSKKLNFFVYQGNMMNIVREYYSNGAYSVSDGFSNGIGLGLEIIKLEKVGINLMCGYAYYHLSEHFSMTGEIGFFYKLGK